MAEDVCHETLLRVVHAIRGGKLDAGEKVAGFVSGTTRNVIREFRRNQQRATPIDDRDFPGPDSTAAVDPPLRLAIERVLQRLKPRDRDLLRLYYYEEQSKEEIARRLGIDPERVRLVKSRALKSFREFYLRIINPRK
jgi:RNA polymerase sigma factor (sigma-70 family)